MNNQPLVEAYKSFSAQGREKLAAGDYAGAREAFLKAAELANKISVNSTSYEVRMEYHNAAARRCETFGYGEKRLQARAEKGARGSTEKRGRGA